jgi:ribosome-binding protein aMBF1 (putative translation factor)
MDCQDWEPVRVISHVAHGGAGGRGGSSTSKRSGNPAGAAIAAKLDAAETPTRSKMLSADAIRTIQDYRHANNNMTQKQLDQRCAFPANTINLLEARRDAPTIKQLQVLNRVLKAGLTLE